jgi:polar amino acid transport system substrate-binding protein
MTSNEWSGATNREALRAELAPTGRLRVGIAVGPAGSALWATRDLGSGQPRGVTVDLGKALAERLGVPLQLVVHNSSGEIIESAHRNTWDVTPVDDERKRQVDFGPNYFLGESTYLVPAGSAITALAEVDRSGVRVVGVESTATIRGARRALKDAAAIGVTSVDEALRMLSAGEADAIALGRESLQSLAPNLPGARVLDGSFHAAGTAIAVPKGKPLALSYAAEFIEAAKVDGTVRRAFDSNGMQDAAVAPPGSRS